MPSRTIYVGRPTLWGNPFTTDRWGHARSVILHKSWLEGRLGAMSLERMGFCPSEIEALDRKRILTFQRFPALRGHNLACWCPISSAWCYADTLIQFANERSQRP